MKRVVRSSSNSAPISVASPGSDMPESPRLRASRTEDIDITRSSGSTMEQLDDNRCLSVRMNLVPEYTIRQVSTSIFGAQTRIEMVGECLPQRSASIVAELVDEGVYVSGELWKLSPTAGIGFQQRFFALFEHDYCLAYWKSKPQSYREEPQGTINLKAVTRVDMEGPLKIILYMQNRDYVVRCSSPSEKDRWFEALFLQVRRALQDALPQEEQRKNYFKEKLESGTVQPFKQLLYPIFVPQWFVMMRQKVDDCSAERWPVFETLDNTISFLRKIRDGKGVNLYSAIEAAWIEQGARPGFKVSLRRYIPNYPSRKIIQQLPPHQHSRPLIARMTKDRGISSAMSERTACPLLKLRTSQIDLVPAHLRFLDHAQVGLLYLMTPSLVSSYFKYFVAVMVSSRPTANGKCFDVRAVSLDPFPMPFGMELDKLYLFDADEQSDNPLHEIHVNQRLDINAAISTITESKNGFEWRIQTPNDGEKVLAARTQREATMWRTCQIMARLGAMNIKERVKQLRRIHSRDRESSLWTPQECLDEANKSSFLFGFRINRPLKVFAHDPPPHTGRRGVREFETTYGYRPRSRSCDHTAARSRLESDYRELERGDVIQYPELERALDADSWGLDLPPMLRRRTYALGDFQSFRTATLTSVCGDQKERFTPHRFFR
eukprot:Selendium_serpulae@DN6076_c0_g1_i5.p1